MRQRSDFDVFGLDEFGVSSLLFHQRLDQRRHFGFGSRLQVQLIEFSERIHGGDYTAIIPLILDITGI
jgi:hypothetical protein